MALEVAVVELPAASVAEGMYISIALCASLNSFRFVGLYTVRHWSSTSGCSPPGLLSCPPVSSARCQTNYVLVGYSVTNNLSPQALTRVDLCHRVEVLEVRPLPCSCRRACTVYQSQIMCAICPITTRAFKTAGTKQKTARVL